MKKLSPKGPDLTAVLTDLYLALMVSVFLLFPGFDGYRTITEDKFRLLCLLTGGYLIATLVLSLKTWLVEGNRPCSPAELLGVSVWPQRLILLYLLWSGLAVLASVEPVRALWGGPRREGFVSIFMYCAAFLMVSFFGRPGKWLLWLFSVCISLCCAVALLQLAGFNPFGLYPEGMDYYDAFVLYAGEFLGTVGNVDLLSAVLCIAIPVFWTGVLRLEGCGRFWLLLPLALSLTVLLGSRVEAGIVGVFGGALLTLPVVIPGSGRKHGAMALFSGGLILLGVVGIWFFGDHLPGFLNEAHHLLHGRAEDTFGSGRIYIWRNVLPLIPERPVFGGGPETLGLRCEISFERYHEQLGVLLKSYVDTAHNEYLNIMLEQGIPAFVFYFGALIMAAVSWVKRAPTSAVAAICGAGVMGYCIQAFFSISSIVSAPFLWLALGLLVADSVPKSRISSVCKGRRNEKDGEVGPMP